MFHDPGLVQTLAQSIQQPGIDRSVQNVAILDVPLQIGVVLQNPCQAHRNLWIHQLDDAAREETLVSGEKMQQLGACFQCSAINRMFNILVVGVQNDCTLA